MNNGVYVHKKDIAPCLHPEKPAAIALETIYFRRVFPEETARERTANRNLIASFQKTMSGPIKMPGTGVLLSSQKHKRCTRSFHDNSETVTLPRHNVSL